MNFLEEIKSKKNAIIVLTIIISMILATTVVSSTVTASAATNDYWDVKLGGKTIAVVKTETEANSIINGVKNYYVVKGAEVISTKVDPALTAEKHSYKKSKGKTVELTTNTKQVVDKLIAGEVTNLEYEVQDGDTVWDVATDKGLSVDELEHLNKEKNLDDIHPGDKIKYTVVKPLVEVTTEQRITSDENIPYDTDTEEDSSMAVGEEKVKTEGVNGTKTVTADVVSKNGTRVSTTEVSSKVTKDPVTAVVVKGTKETEASSEGTTTSSYSSRSYDGPTYSGSGSDIASYASQFVGNPYVYGGTSLTNGADCSGFLYRVFNNCGYGIPRTGQDSIGRSVSMSEARAGDIIVYPGHYSLYIGGGQEVHALNPSAGIQITGVGYVGPVLDVRRVVE